MTITRIGATKTYAQNWGLAFRPKPAAKSAGAVPKPKAAAPKGTVKKPAKGKGK